MAGWQSHVLFAMIRSGGKRAGLTVVVIARIVNEDERHANQHHANCCEAYEKHHPARSFTRHAQKIPATGRKMLDDRSSTSQGLAAINRGPLVPIWLRLLA